MSWEPSPALVWTSSMRRCIEPARLLASNLRAQVLVDDRLSDADMGTWTGQKWQTSDGDLAAWFRGGVAPHGGEELSAIEARVRRWWKALDLRTSHALVAHEIVALALRTIVHHESWAYAHSASVGSTHLEVFERFG